MTAPPPTATSASWSSPTLGVGTMSWPHPAGCCFYPLSAQLQGLPRGVWRGRPGEGVAGSGTSRTATAAEQCGLADLQRRVPGILGSSRQPFKHITSDQRRGQGGASVTTPGASRCKHRALARQLSFPQIGGKGRRC